MKKKKINIGVADLKVLNRENSYFVDKSLIVQNVIDGSEVTLIPRPRRFGKTLNMSVLKYYFDMNGQAEDKSLFDGLKIMDAGEEYTKHKNQYPVISLSLKKLEGPDWKSALEKLTIYFSKLYRKNEYLLDVLSPEDKSIFNRIMKGKSKLTELNNCLDYLIQALYKYHKKPVVVLIDEYDSPIIWGYDNGYYDEIIEFMRNWLGTALKNNDETSLNR